MGIIRELVIDDERTFKNIDALYCRTSQEALTVLKELFEEKGQIGRLWLDHDLGGGDTTIPVVDYLSELAFTGNMPKIWAINVHTQNPVGGENIVRSLVRYGYPAKRSILPSHI